MSLLPGCLVLAALNTGAAGLVVLLAIPVRAHLDRKDPP